MLGYLTFNVAAERHVHFFLTFSCSDTEITIIEIVMRWRKLLKTSSLRKLKLIVDYQMNAQEIELLQISHHYES